MTWGEGRGGRWDQGMSGVARKFVKGKGGGGGVGQYSYTSGQRGKRKRERQTDRQTDRPRETDRETRLSLLER